MNPWETLQLRAEGMLKGTQRILDEGGDAVAVDGVRDAIHAVLDVCRKQLKGKLSDRMGTLATNGHEGEATVAQQVDRLVARAEETGTLSGPPPTAPDVAAVLPFVPPHLAAVYAAYHSGESE